MNITYTKDISTPINRIKNLPHSVLAKKIRKYIEKRGVVQPEYAFKTNNEYLFIYLECNDRIDIEL